MLPTGRHLIVTCIIFSLIPSSVLRAQQGGAGSIIGELHLSRGDFPGRIFIELQFRSATIASGYCDDQGKFGFTGLESNPYHLVIHDERFYPIDQLVVLDTSISTVSMAQISLMPHETAKGEPPPPARELGSNPHLIDPSEYRRHFPKNAIKEFDKGVEADRNQKRDEAIGHYEKSIFLAPDFYPAHNNLGSAYLSKADFKSAQAHFEEAIKLNQSDAEAHLNLANVLLMTKNYDDALKEVEEGLRRKPNSAFGQYILGSVYERMRKLPEAEHALREALKLDPAMSRVRLELVNVYLVQQKKAEASVELKAFVKDSPSDPLAPKAKEILEKLAAAH
jgi:tetratricopeptide (TPR) repeat protein